MRNVETRYRRPFTGRLTARHAVGGPEQDAERSECPAVMTGIPGETFPAPQGGRRSAGLWSCEHRTNRMKAWKADDVLRDGALRMFRPFRQPAGNVKHIYNVRVSPQEIPLQRPEPCEGKLSRTVLRGAWG
ncbi:MAG: hypothetical protein B6245_12355 [Desulfobacteraceae bacterium 4572_88]|nr:MAG: hypothetical protein B6245_12355 [Desulfobacteraceae bacterium 4572_88]